MLALNTDEVFSTRNVKLSGAKWARSKTLPISFVKFSSRSTLRALILVDWITGLARDITFFARF